MNGEHYVRMKAEMEGGSGKPRNAKGWAHLTEAKKRQERIPRSSQREQGLSNF